MPSEIRILVAGRNGQVARSLAEVADGTQTHLVALGRPDLDLTSPETVTKAIDAAQPDIIINAAAHTAVDQAESDPETAHAINDTGAGRLARAAAEYGVPIFHLSTDYVFDGSKPEPYVETDAVSPLGVYGASKLAGEQAVTAANQRAFIFRTAWVYSPFGKNFAKTMLRLAAGRDEVGVVADQRGNPTNALDIADALLLAARHVVSGDAAAPAGIYHLAGSDEAVWADFAEHVFAVSQTAGGPVARVRRITTEEFPTPVRRPANSRLNCEKLATTFGVTLPDWRTSAADCVARLVKQKDWTS